MRLSTLATRCPTHYSAQTNFEPMDGKSRTCQNNLTWSRLTLSSTLQALFRCLSR
jgi:hypothetical protein